MNVEIKTALLISGSGSTAEAVLEARHKGELDGIYPVAVIASRSDAPGLEKARRYHVDTYVVDRKMYQTSKQFGDDLLTLLKTLGVEFVSQNGWLPKTPDSVIEMYAGRIINQHPGPLDPGRVDFGGKGMYGSRVSAARLGYAWLSHDPNEHWTEATIHNVTQEYDKGGLIAVSRQSFSELGRPVTVADLTTSLAQAFIEGACDLQDSLIRREHQLVIETLRTIGATQSIPIYQRDRPLIPAVYILFVEEAKSAAIQTFPQG